MRLGRRLVVCAAGLALAGGTAAAVGAHVKAAPSPVGCALDGPSEVPATPAISNSCSYTTVSGAEEAVMNPGMAVDVTWQTTSGGVVTNHDVFVNPACQTNALPNPSPGTASANCPAGTLSDDPAAISIPANTLVTVTEGNAGTVGPVGGGGAGGAVVGENPAG